MKKLLSVLVAAIMLFAVLPTGITAGEDMPVLPEDEEPVVTEEPVPEEPIDTEEPVVTEEPDPDLIVINYIDLWGVDKPSFGSHPDYRAGDFSDYCYEVTDIAWYRIDSDDGLIHELPPEETFDAEEDGFFVMISFAADEGFRFASPDYIYIWSYPNLPIAHIDVGEDGILTITSMTFDAYGCDFEYTPIELVEAAGFEEVEYGAYPKRYLSFPEDVDESVYDQYSIAFVNWYWVTEDGVREMRKYDYFVNEGAYYCEIVFGWYFSYGFNEDTTALIDGSDELIDTITKDEFGRLVVKTVELTCPDPEYFDSVELSVEFPVYGEEDSCNVELCDEPAEWMADDGRIYYEVDVSNMGCFEGYWGDFTEEGNVYSVSAVIYIKNGYEITDDFDAVINYDPELVRSARVENNPRGRCLRVRSVEFTLDGGFAIVPDQTVIKEVSIWADFSCCKPGYAAESFPYVRSDADYYIPEGLLVWYNEDSFEAVSPEYRFEEGGIYCMGIAIATKKGFRFSDDCVFYINGHTYLIDHELSRLINGRSAMIWTSTVLCERYPGDPDYDTYEIVICGVEAPEAGETPDSYEITVPEDVYYSISDYVWTDSNMTDITDPDYVFEQGKSYYIRVELETPENAIFEKFWPAFADESDVYFVDSLGFSSLTVWYGPFMCGDALPGDATGDGVVDTEDALHVLRWALGLEDYDTDQGAICDMNGDGVIDTVDALIVLRMALGII